MLFEVGLLLSCRSLLHWGRHLIHRGGCWREMKGEGADWSVPDLDQMSGPWRSRTDEYGSGQLLPLAWACRHSYSPYEVKQRYLSGSRLRTSGEAGGKKAR